MLDNESEKALKMIIDDNKNQLEKNGKSVLIYSEDCIRKPIIENLNINHLIKIKNNMSSFSGYTVMIELTYDGENYFLDKQKKQKTKKLKLFWELVKFILPILISVAALIVSIIK